MRALSQEQGELLYLLLQIADGDPSLVRRSFTEATTTGQPPSIRELTHFILLQRGRKDVVDRLRAL